MTSKCSHCDKPTHNELCTVCTEHGCCEDHCEQMADKTEPTTQENCEHCGGNRFTENCPTCGAPVCCAICCDIQSMKDRLEAAETLIVKQPPWKQKPLSDWAIVGMNHYHVKGQQFLFVSMQKDGRCITEEGQDDVCLWKRLTHKAILEKDND